MPTIERPSSTSFDADGLRHWYSLAVELIGAAQGRLDAENLFPVADGDTGANVLATLESGVEALASAQGELTTLAKAAARATLIEAKGNSGVILSEILRGFADGLAGGLASALISADVAAQRAVARPVGGTILTAMTAAAGAVRPAMSDREVAIAAWSAARSSALSSASSPPVPSALGTIDAGAHALERILAALAATLDPSLLPIEALPNRTSGISSSTSRSIAPAPDGDFEVMYLLPDTGTQAADDLREKLSRLGESVLVVGSSELWNVHVHTNDAGGAIEAGIAVGKPNRIRVISLSPLAGEEVCETKRRIIAVANGIGIANVLRSAGAEVILAFDSRRVTADEWSKATIGAREVLLLPHDRHGLLSAQESISEIRQAGIRVAVLPTRSTVQALAAIAVHDPLRDFDDDIVAMTAAAGHTRYATLAFSRASNHNTMADYEAGDAIGIIDGEIRVAGRELSAVAQDVLQRMLMGGGEILTLITGADATREMADQLAKSARLLAPAIEITIHDGGQAWAGPVGGLRGPARRAGLPIRPDTCRLGAGGHPVRPGQPSPVDVPAVHAPGGRPATRLRCPPRARGWRASGDQRTSSRRRWRSPATSPERCRWRSGSPRAGRTRVG